MEKRTTGRLETLKEKMYNKETKSQTKFCSVYPLLPVVFRIPLPTRIATSCNPHFELISSIVVSVSKRPSCSPYPTRYPLPATNLHMQAIVFDPKTNNFGLQEIPKPKPGKDDVLVKVEACALNPIDFKIAYFKDMIPATANNYVAGLDVSGTIVEVGDAVEDWKTGDRVLYHGDLQRGMGGLAEFAVHKSATLLRHPAVNADDAAATPCAGWTAYRCLVDKLRVNEDDVLVISGASGGVGGFAVQLANILGVKTIVGICSAKNIPYVMSLGATHVIDYKSQDVGKEIMAITDGKGASKVLDAVGGKSCEDLIQVMGFDAELVSIVQPVNISADKNPVFGGHSFHHLGLGAAHGSGPQHEARLAEVGKQVTQYLADGKLRSCLTKVIGLKDVPSALQQMMAQRTVGKVVVSMSQNPSKKHYKK